MAGASPGQVVAAKKRLDNTQAEHHPLADALFPPTDNDDLLKKFGQDRSAMALNFVSTKPDATAVRYTPNSKIALGKDAHAIADEEGTAIGQRIAQEVRAAGGTGAEAAIAGNDARQHFKHYARGQITEEQMTPNQNRNIGPLAQDQTDSLGNQLAEPRRKQPIKGEAIQQAEAQGDALIEAHGARGDRHGNVNLGANGFRWVGKQALSQPEETAQLTAERPPLAQATVPQATAQPIQRYTVNSAAVREALASFRPEQPIPTTARFSEPYKLGNFKRPNHANLTIVSVAQEQENLA